MTGDVEDVNAVSLRDFLVKTKNNNPSTRYCPTHPGCKCAWTSSRSYFYLKCFGDEKRDISPHQMNLLSILGNFDLSGVKDSAEIRRDILYALTTYPQAKRHSGQPGFPIPGMETRMDGLVEKGERTSSLPTDPKRVDGKTTITNMCDATPIRPDELRGLRKRNFLSIESNEPLEVEERPAQEEGEYYPETNEVENPLICESDKETPTTKSSIVPRNGSKWFCNKAPSPIPEIVKIDIILGRKFRNLGKIPPFELPIDCHFYEMKNLAWKYIKETISPLFIVVEPTGWEDDLVMESSKILREIFDTWFYPPMKRNFRRAIGSFAINYFNYEEFSIRTEYDEVSGTYWHEYREIKDIIKESELRKLDSDIRAKKYYDEPTPPQFEKTYAQVAVKGIPASYYAKLQEKHLNRLKSDPEYAIQFIKAGKQPAPMRNKTELTVIHIKGKRTNRRDLRAAYKSLGINTSKLVDINFIGKSVTALTVPLEYKEIAYAIFDKIDISLRDFNPLDPSTNKYSVEDKDPLERFLLRQEGYKESAEKRGKKGLANFYKSTMVETAMEEYHKSAKSKLAESDLKPIKSEFMRKSAMEIKFIIDSVVTVPHNVHASSSSPRKRMEL